ncbi:MAG TPA: GNAT family N-acetyltransferase [Thermoanaerobaculia bacterium]|nr:GNAT family N-acetyltransferase [Thermoanaerobaculia bacterium]
MNTRQSHEIERLTMPLSEADVRELARLLVDVVGSGAAVSFVAPLTLERAEQWWRTTIASSDPRALVFIASDGERIAGSVQLHPSWAPNQPDRGEITKLLVHPGSRRLGLGTRLMQTVEEEARRSGFRLLTLDTKRGDAAETLYRRMGWICVGTIPRFAFDPDGVTPHDAVIFYKELSEVPRAKKDDAAVVTAPQVEFGGATPILRVKDFEVSLAYYVNVLGFELRWRDHGFGCVGRDDATLMLSQGSQGCAGTWVYLGVSDADALHDEVRARGAAIRHPPTNYPWGSRELHLFDPDGHVLRLGSDLKPGEPFGEWLDEAGVRWRSHADGSWTRGE